MLVAEIHIRDGKPLVGFREIVRKRAVHILKPAVDAFFEQPDVVENFSVKHIRIFVVKVHIRILVQKLQR